MPRSTSKSSVDPRIRHIRYACTRCERTTPREDLTQKQVAFVQNGRKTRQRTVAWLCPQCLDEDIEWNLPKRAAAPGMSDTRLAD
jgi:hypothetical protein